MPSLKALRVFECSNFLGVADTAERAASYTPNLQELIIERCPTAEEGQLNQLRILLPALQSYAFIPE
jgi:hypothetical protein